MSELTDLFTNGFKQLNSENSQEYSNIYHHFFGIHVDQPNNVLGIETTDVDFPEFEDLSKFTQKILLSGEIRIGVYIHEPYFYINEEKCEDEFNDENCYDGFEHMLAIAVFERISNRYLADTRKHLTITWVPVEVDFSGEESGSENTVIIDALSPCLMDLGKKNDTGDCDNCPERYHMAFTGIFAFVDAHENIKYDLHYAEPTGVFYISALYTGKGGFVHDPRDLPPTESLKDTAKFFAKKSYDNHEKIIIIHSAGFLQTQSAELLRDVINIYEGKARTVEISNVEEIEPSITNKDSHIYVGDLIQIHRMVKENADCYNLNTNILFEGCNREGCDAHVEDSSDSDCKTNPFRAYSPFTLPD